MAGAESIVNPLPGFKLITYLSFGADLPIQYQTLNSVV